jgi:xylan 1,4-beta-xylosidase
MLGLSSKDAYLLDERSPLVLRARIGTSALLLFALLATTGVFGSAQEQVVIDARAQSTPFPHYWEQMFGSGRAILSLRESYREDLRAVSR